ncbi:MAG: hypothetical protein IJY23_01085 [Clostridia bacterium]|nr:hypothetical protein [Clostridia bacterium]
MKKSKSHYHNGKRWGFAVAKAQITSGKLGVAKADKAMQTCSRIARTGTKKLNKNERDAYRGMADGMYEAFRNSEKRSRNNPTVKKRSFKKPLKVKRDKYKVDIFVEDNFFGDRFTARSFAPSIEEALRKKEEAREYMKSTSPRRLISVDTAISKNHKKFKFKNKK